MNTGDLSKSYSTEATVVITPGLPCLDATRYRVLGRIGGGGMADVYQGIHLGLQRNVAIKVMDPYLLRENPTFLQRFQNEAAIAGNMRHAHIVETLDAGLTEDSPSLPYLTMELLQGDTLASRLSRQQTVTPEMAITITRALLDALAYASDKGIVHRDIKPTNIFLCDDGNIKLMDFGIALAIHNRGATPRLTTFGERVGTFAYMPPEVISGVNPDAPPDPRSDLYSVGITLYEMLVGKPPFPFDNPATAAYHHMHAPVPDLPPTVPANLQYVVIRALAKTPEERFANATEMRTALDKADDRPISAVKPQPAAPTKGINVRWIVAGLALILIGIASVVVMKHPAVPPQISPSPTVQALEPPPLSKLTLQVQADAAAKRAEELLNQVTLRSDELAHQSANQRTPEEAARYRKEMWNWATEALQQAELVIKYTPKRATGYFQKGYALYWLERYPEAYRTVISAPKSVADDSNLKVLQVKILKRYKP